MDDLNTRDAALAQVVECEDCSPVIYYIETLESIIRHLANGEVTETKNESEVLALVVGPIPE